MQEFEQKHGRIPQQAIVLMNFGWGDRFPDASKIFNTDDVTDRTSFSFPAVHPSTALFLGVKRNAIAIGVDSPAVEAAGSEFFPTHRIMSQCDMLALEFLANVDQLPPTGALVVVGMVKLDDASGPPARVLALVNDDCSCFSGAQYAGQGGSRGGASSLYQVL